MNALVTFKEQELALIRRTVAKDCGPAEFDMFIHIARHVGLDPLRRQIYAFVFGKGKKDSDRQLTVVTSIDGYRTISERTGNYRPDNRTPRYVYNAELKSSGNPLGIESCEVSVFKFAHGGWHEAPGFVHWDEFCPTAYRDEDCVWTDTGEKWPDGNPKRKKVPKDGAVLHIDQSKLGWVKSGRNQIAKCAEAQAHRKAFPNDFSGVEVEEEVHRRMSEELTASELADEADKIDRMAKIGGQNLLVVDWLDGSALTGVPADKFLGSAMDFVRKETPDTINVFCDRNRIALQQFWGCKPGEALELKKEIEKLTALNETQATEAKSKK